jgi:hypothetical protein
MDKEQAWEFVREQLDASIAGEGFCKPDNGNLPTVNEHTTKWHYGKCEIAALLDKVYADFEIEKAALVAESSAALEERDRELAQARTDRNYTRSCLDECRKTLESWMTEAETWKFLTKSMLEKDVEAAMAEQMGCTFEQFKARLEDEEFEAVEGKSLLEAVEKIRGLIDPSGGNYLGIYEESCAELLAMLPPVGKQDEES